MSRFIPHWRKATWTLVIWTILGILWLWAGWSNVAEGGTTDAEAVGGAIGSMIVIFFWFLGFVVLSIIWFMSRPSNDGIVEVYTPDGSKALTSPHQAKRLVKEAGYTYEPPSPPTPAT